MRVDFGENANQFMRVLKEYAAARVAEVGRARDHPVRLGIYVPLRAGDFAMRRLRSSAEGSANRVDGVKGLYLLRPLTRGQLCDFPQVKISVQANES